MLESGDWIEVSPVGETWIINQGSGEDWAVRPSFASLSSKRPYLVNLSAIECVVGEWNKDKTQYGVRIFYASGNSVWVDEDAAKALFEKIEISALGKDEISCFDKAKRTK